MSNYYNRDIIDYLYHLPNYLERNTRISRRMSVVMIYFCQGNVIVRNSTLALMDREQELGQIQD